MDELGLRAGLRSPADRHPARLVVAEVRARADLEPFLDAGRPDFEVVLLCLDEAHLAGRHQEHAVGQAEPLEQDLGPFGEPLEGGRRIVGHLRRSRLVERCDPSRPPDVIEERRVCDAIEPCEKLRSAVESVEGLPCFAVRLLRQIGGQVAVAA